LAIDPSGNAYVSGFTQSSDFPTVSAVQPSFPGNPYAVYLNSGSNWIAFGSKVPGIVSQLSVNPSGASAVVLADSGIYRTTNGGSSWTQQSAAQFSSDFDAYISRSPASSSTLYAADCCGSSYRSTDDGITWAESGNPSLSYQLQGILADPLISTTVYAYGSGSVQASVFASTDGGVTWNAAAAGLSVATVYSMVATSDGTLYAGTRGSGIYTSKNQGGSWSAANSGLPANGFALNNTSLSASGNTVYFASGTIYTTTNDGASWTALPNTVGGYTISASPLNPSILFVLNQNAPAEYTVEKSTDGGATWTVVETGLPPNLGFSTTELLADPSNAGRAYLVAPVGQAAFVGKLNPTGAALVWSTFLGGYSVAYSYALANDGAGNTFVAGYTDGSGFPATSSALPAGIYKEVSGGVNVDGTFVTKISDTTAACSSMTITPGATTVQPFGSTSYFSVVVPSGCTWTASTNQSWAVVATAPSGTGTGIVAVQTPDNSTSATQTATLTVGSQSAIITQPSLDCYYTTSPNFNVVSALGGFLSVVLTTYPGCPWTIPNNYPAAIAITSGSSGTGSGTINLTVAANPSTGSRTFYFSSPNSGFSISQDGSTGTVPQTISFGAIGNVTLGASFTVSATASSGLGVEFGWVSQGVCTMLGDTVTVFGTGTCSITATQAGNATYAAAASVTQSFTVTLSPCDLKQTGSVTAADVQLIINEALGVAPVVYDLSDTGVATVVDVQIEINAALGLGCTAK
jgi:photosystem II stability/assembly factor-like uncharacterized protein